jgi:hypothetical protein
MLLFPSTFRMVIRKKSFIACSMFLILVLSILASCTSINWPEWTGFSENVKKIDNQKGEVAIEYQPSKTLWDFFQLLLVPVFLAGGAYWLQQSSKKRELVSQEQLAQEATLQNYLDKITELLIKEHVLDNGYTSTAQSVLRLRTLTALRMLDGNRRTIILRFLIEADLIKVNNPKIHPTAFDWNRVNLSQGDISNICLQGTNLSNSNFSGSIISNVNLEFANLRFSNLSNARFYIAGFSKDDRKQLPPQEQLKKIMQNLMKINEDYFNVLHRADEEFVNADNKYWKDIADIFLLRYDKTC